MSSPVETESSCGETFSDSSSSSISSLLHWTNPLKTAAVFLPVTLVLFSIQHLSLISVIAWSALIPMLVVVVSQLYWYVMVFLLKKLPHVPESDPLNGIHDVQLEVPTETMQFVSEAVSEVINKTGSALKDTYLFKNIKKSLYFAVSMYCLTFIGALFNFSTVLILTWIGLFTIPKLYSNNQELVDSYVLKAKSKALEVNEKVNSFVPKKGSPVKEE